MATEARGGRGHCWSGADARPDMPIAQDIYDGDGAGMPRIRRRRWDRGLRLAVCPSFPPWHGGGAARQRRLARSASGEGPVVRGHCAETLAFKGTEGVEADVTAATQCVWRLPLLPLGVVALARQESKCDWSLGRLISHLPNARCAQDSHIYPPLLYASLSSVVKFIFESRRWLSIIMSSPISTSRRSTPLLPVVP